MVLLQQKIISNEGICNCPGRLQQGKYFKQIVSLVMDLDELKALCNFKCATHYADIAYGAYERKCYHLTIWAGEQSYAYLDKLGEVHTVLKFGPSSLIARSYFDMGNVSLALMWLKIAVKHTSEAIRLNYFDLELRDLRLLLCRHTLSSKCYFYFLRDNIHFLPFLFMVFPIWYMYKNAGHEEEMTLSTETGLTEQKYHFIWSQLSTVHTPNFVEQWINAWINAVIFLGAVILALFYYFILCWCLKCCFSCCCTRLRAIITIIFVTILLSIDWL